MVYVMCYHTGMSAASSATKSVQQSPELPPGFELLNFTIERKLGRGGFAITYLARETASERPVVIKENFVQECSMRNTASHTLVPSGDEGRGLYEWALTRFLDEAKVLIRLNHPCIVQVLTVFKALGTAYYVMPLVKGAELNQAAPAPGQINEAWLRPVLEQLLGALDYLHGQGLLHRDIKPSNILLRHDGSPLLIDFGTARVKDATHTLTHVGTPGYSPSEQFAIHGKNGPWTDLYSLGVTCYHLITGEVPQDCISRLEDDDLRPLAGRAELKRRFSHKFLAAIDKAMSVARRDRWQSAQEWLAAMQGGDVPCPATAPEPEPAEAASQAEKLELGDLIMENVVGGVLAGIGLGYICGGINDGYSGAIRWAIVWALLFPIGGVIAGIVGNSVGGGAMGWRVYNIIILVYVVVVGFMSFALGL